MAFNFSLPTTSTLAFSSFLRCDSHPSLLVSATTQRILLRNTLKQHKRMRPESQASNLSTIISAINSYLPDLLSLEKGLAGHLVNSESIFVALTREPECEWRSSILSPPPGRQAPRIKGTGLDYEILFVLATLGYAHCLSARRHLAPYANANASSRFTADQRKSAHSAAANALLTAHSVFTHAAEVAESVPAGSLPSNALDIQTPVLTALAELCWAHATLLAVNRDDDFLTLLAQSRDSNDNEWMYKPPNVPKGKVTMNARLCLAAAEHADKTLALLSGISNVRDDLLKHAKDLAVTARARSCRFSGVHADSDGKYGEALGWINAGRRVLGLPVVVSANPSTSKFKSLKAMQAHLAERKERKVVESAKGPSLDDPGRVEEGRVLEMVGTNWARTNDLIGHQLVSDEHALLEAMPSGREVHSARTWVVPMLDAAQLEKLRAPVDRDEDDMGGGLGGDSDDDSGDEIPGHGMPGGFDATNGVGRSGTAVSDAYF